MGETVTDQTPRRPLCPRLLKLAESSFFTQEEISREERERMVSEVECLVGCSGPDRVPYNIFGGKVLRRLNIGDDICTDVRIMVPRQSTESPVILPTPLELPQ